MANISEAISYSRLWPSNRWGLRGHGLATGQIVSVFKRRGGVETEEVGRFVRSFKDGSQLFTIAGRVAAGPIGRGVNSHVFTAPREDEQYAD
jgi:hypothetical protein